MIVSTIYSEIDEYYSCQGPNIILYRFQPLFAYFILKCYQDDRFIRHYRLYQRHYKGVTSLKKELLTVQSLPPKMLKSIEWVIVHKQSHQPIGLAGLVNYHHQNQHAELLVGLLDSKNTRQKFYGPEATLLAIEYAFQTIKLNKLISYVYRYNNKAQKDTLRLGFQQEGLLRQHILDHSGKYIDLFQNALLNSEYFKNKKLARLSKRLIGCDITQKKETSSNNILSPN